MQSDEDLADTVAEGSRLPAGLRERLSEAAARTVAGDDRVTVTSPPEEGDEASLAVTLEHPGRYTGPRRGGQTSDGPVELGRGGIGRVLIAHDVHLGREVAVKELLHRPDGPAGPRTPTNPRESLAAARFLREARLTGQLEHPNIVPVYELGTRPDGTLYYTMKVVRGRNLASALEAVKNDGLQARLKLIGHYADLCDAIAYAHSRGVIHRDIKPENVMVGEFGETVVLDWGLAKPKHAEDLAERVPGARVTQPSLPSQTAHTAPATSRVDESAVRGLAATDDGTLLGTPMYMSPEQAQGDLAAIDERSDVWALGVVLYEILTGEPPFTGKTAVELLLKVVQGGYAKVAERCPQAPPELAAIAEKALSRNPAYRYPDARAMAEEVRAFLTGGRVQAYNYRAWTLVKRWASRHKAALVVAALALVALISLGVVSYIQIADERDRAMAAESDAMNALALATEARGRAESAEAEAGRARDSAESLVRYMVSDLKDRLEPLGQLSLLDDVAAAVEKHYDDTAGVLSDTPSTAMLEAPARMRNRASVTALIGDLARARGDLAAAGQAYAKAEMLRDALIAQSDKPEHRADRSESHRQRGLLLRMQGDLAGAQRELARAREIRAALFADAPDAFPVRRALVQSELDRGDLATLLGDLRQAESAYTVAVELARGLVSGAADETLGARARFDLSVALDGLGTAYLDLNQLERARAAFDEALELRRALLDKHPSNRDWRHRVAISHARMGEIDELMNKHEDAEKHWQRAAGITERLLRQDPDNARWARDLAVAHNHLGDLHLAQGRHQPAREAFAKALEQIGALAARDPSNAELQRDVEVGEIRLGDTALVLDDVPAALAGYTRGLAIAERLTALDPQNTQWQHDLAHASSKVALARARGGDVAGATPLAERARAVMQALTAKDPSNPAWAQDLQAADNLLARLRAGGPFDGGMRPDLTQKQRSGRGGQTQRPEAFKTQPVRPTGDAKEIEAPPQPQRQRPAPAPAKEVVPPPDD